MWILVLLVILGLHAVDKWLAQIDTPRADAIMRRQGEVMAAKIRDLGKRS